MNSATVCFSALLGLLLFAASPALAGNYEILYDTRAGSGFFGGDDREAAGPRSVGVGQSVLVDTTILLESFSFYFTSRFDYAENPTGSGHAVDLTLHVRDETGAIVSEHVLSVPASYSGGWVSWTGIDLAVSAGTTLIFTCYLNGAYDTLELTNGHASDSAAGYADGARYVKTGTTDEDMEAWSGWAEHIWDSMFWLQGTTSVPVEAVSWSSLKASQAQ